MKICLIVDDYMPDSTKVAAKMMHELAINLVQHHHDVSVITPNPNIKSNLSIMYLDGVKIYRFKSGQIKNISKARRAINELLLSYLAWKHCKKELIPNRHDLIVYYSPSIFLGGLVKKLKKTWVAPSYLVLRDLFPQWAIDNNILKEHSIITKFFRYFETINYNSADRIGLMSQKNLSGFNEKYEQKYVTEVLYNWASDKQNNQENTYRKDLNLEDKIIFFYGGNMGHAQDMENLLRLAKSMLIHLEAHFLFVGTGDEVPSMKRYIRRENLTNVTLLKAVNQQEFKKILSIIDVGLFSLNYNHTTHNFPGKLLGYMCEKKPILGSINPQNDLKDIIEDSMSGYISINGEDDLFYQNAVKLLNKPHQKEIGLNAYNLLKSHFSVDSARAKILSIKA